MAEAENYIENLTEVEDSNLQKLTEHLLCARQQARGRGGECKIPWSFGITAEGCTHSQGMCRRQDEDEKCFGQMNWPGEPSRSGLVPKSLHFY